MNCDEFRTALGDSTAGRLDADRRRALEAHAAGCVGCARLLRRRGRPPRLVALAFLAAFGASIFTLIYTGLNVRDAGSAGDVEGAAEPERPEAAAEQPAPLAEPASSARTRDAGDSDHRAR